MNAEEYLKRIENERLNSTPLYSKQELLFFAEAYYKAKVNAITDDYIELELLKDKTYKRYGDRAKEAYFFGAKWLKQKLLNQ